MSEEKPRYEITPDPELAGQTREQLMGEIARLRLALASVEADWQMEKAARKQAMHEAEKAKWFIQIRNMWGDYCIMRMTENPYGV